MAEPTELDKLPDRFWWLKPLYQFGVPAAIAVFLVWSMVERFDDKLDAVQSGSSAMHADLAAHQINTQYMIKSLTETRQILYRICVNTARTDSDRRACFPSE